MEVRAKGAAQNEQTFPPDGMIIRVSDRRAQVAWLPVTVLGMFALCIAVYAPEGTHRNAGRGESIRTAR